MTRRLARVVKTLLASKGLENWIVDRLRSSVHARSVHARDVEKMATRVIARKVDKMACRLLARVLEKLMVAW